MHHTINASHSFGPWFDTWHLEVYTIMVIVMSSYHPLYQTTPNVISRYEMTSMCINVAGIVKTGKGWFNGYPWCNKIPRSDPDSRLLTWWSQEWDTPCDTDDTDTIVITIVTIIVITDPAHIITSYLLSPGQSRLTWHLQGLVTMLWLIHHHTKQSENKLNKRIQSHLRDI